MPRNFIPSSGLIGELVHSNDGKVTGQIEEILLDTESATIAYAIISLEKAEGFGEKLLAFPWSGIHADLSQGGDGFILNVGREALITAPLFTKSNWPNFADPQFESKLKSHFGIRSPDAQILN